MHLKTVLQTEAPQIRPQLDSDSWQRSLAAILQLNDRSFSCSIADSRPASCDMPYYMYILCAAHVT